MQFEFEFFFRAGEMMNAARVSQPFQRSVFNTATLLDYCPIQVQEGESMSGVWYPVERMVFVEPYLRRIGVPLLMVGSHQMQFIPHDDPITLKKELRLQQQEPFNYENWYCGMKGLKLLDNDGNLYDPLPDAFIVPLNQCQVTEMVRIAKLKQPTSIHTLGNTQEWTDDDQISYNTLVTWFDEKMNCYQKLLDVSQMNPENEIILPSYLEMDGEESECYQHGFFVRLSGRSPKDFIAQLVTASVSGNDVMNRLIHSTRSKACFNEYLKSKDPGKSISVIFLPWDNNLNAALEFRCFVHLHKLTAISQYDCYHTFPMFANPELCFHIKERIENFYKQIKPFVPFHSCILDVMLKPVKDMRGEFIFQVTVSEDRPDWRVHLLEFNPFYADVSSGAGLFDWQQDLDILYNGTSTGDSVLRVRVKPPSTSGRTPTDRPKNPFIVDII